MSWLAAVGVAPLAIAAVALAMFRWSKKPHYLTLAQKWGRGGAWSALAGSLLALVSLSGRGPLERAWALSAGTGRALGWAVGVIGFVAAAAYACALLRSADGYAARSGFRIGASLGLAGLGVQLVVSHPGARGVGLALLAIMGGLLAIEWLWRSYAREPAWLLRTSAVALPIASGAIVGLHV